MAAGSQVPQSLKSIQPYIKIAEEHDKRDPAISYWCRYYAVQTGLKLVDKSPGDKKYFFGIMDLLENIKTQHPDNESITNDVVAQAHIESYALKLFLWADNQDRSAVFNKNVVKAFYTAGFIYDIVSTFGEISEEVQHHKKYAKWKATYIHNCLKNGETPIAGPLAMEGEDEGFDLDEPPSSSSQQPGDTPYPTIGFNIPESGPSSQGINFTLPGSHAPPSTPNSTMNNIPSMSVVEETPAPRNEGDVVLRPQDYHKAEKYCKWAGSALQYEDVPTAITNLQKALRLLTTGQDT